jgi:hypothetical protein
MVTTNAFGVLDVAFMGLAALFTVWNVVTLVRYASYRRLAATAELTWSQSRPWFYNLCLVIGFFMVSLTALSLFVLHRPVLATVSQALMAFYYTVVFPLSFRIRRGFYEKGIWFERAFVPYENVRRVSWREQPDIMLVALKETELTGQSYARLTVPGERYGEARRILASHIEDQTLTIESSILGLSEGEIPAQEQV